LSLSHRRTSVVWTLHAHAGCCTQTSRFVHTRTPECYCTFRWNSTHTPLVYTHKCCTHTHHLKCCTHHPGECYYLKCFDVYFTHMSLSCRCIIHIIT
jgi:hypothetical protein